MLLFGQEGQERIAESSVFIAGAGGLGCPVALYLATAGVGKITLVDHDTVELSNLNRQVLHWEEDIGRRKSESAAWKLARINSTIAIDARCVTIDESNAAELVGDADLIVDAMDNFGTRYILNRVAIGKGIPLFHGAIRGFDGQVTTVVPGKTACLRCIFPHPPPAEEFPVVGATPGIIGLIQANEVIKYITGAGPDLGNRLLLWNGIDATLETLPLERDPCCTECGSSGEKG